MYNLLSFVARFHAFFLFLGLELLCLLLIVRYNPFQRASILNSSNSIAGEVYERANNGREYMSLKEVNDSLLRENARLKSQVVNLEQSVEDNVELWIQEQEYCLDTSQLAYFQDFETNVDYQFIGAKVISNSTLKPNNFITINKGRKDGVRKEMGVIGRNGIIGVVKDVSNNFATVVSLLHKSMRISAKIDRNNFIGSLRWDGKDPRYAILNDIPKHANISTGDTIVTSGFSAFFPPNIFVGVAENYFLAEGSNFFDIKVRLSTNFSSLKYIYVVDYIRKKEQEALEESLKNE